MSTIFAIQFQEANSALNSTISELKREDKSDGSWCIEGEDFPYNFQGRNCTTCGGFGDNIMYYESYPAIVRCKCYGAIWPVLMLDSFGVIPEDSESEFYSHYQKISEVFKELAEKSLKIKERKIKEREILSKEEKAITLIRDALGPKGHNSEECKLCKTTLDRMRGITGTSPNVFPELQWLVAHAHHVSRNPIDTFCKFDLMMYVDWQTRFFKHNLSEEAKKHHRHPNGYLDDLSQEVIAISIEFFETLTPNLEDCY